VLPRKNVSEEFARRINYKPLIYLVVAAGFEPTTPSR